MKSHQHILLSGVLYTLVIILWPVFMAVSQPQGSINEQLVWISEHITLYKTQCFFALLIAPSFIYMMVAQLEISPKIPKLSYRIGFGVICSYIVMVSIAYGTQVVVLPKLIKAGLTEQARVWYMLSDYSVTYFINQMGYFFWAVGVLVLFAKYTRAPGMIKYISILYLVSSVLSIMAFIGLILDSPQINSLTLYSGLTIVPVGILSIVLGFQVKNHMYEWD